MSFWRFVFLAMGSLCLVHSIASLVTEGFPAGGISFFASVCAFQLARKGGSQ